MSDEIRSRTAALTGLRRELAARGFGRKAPGRVVIELAVHVALAVGGLIVFFASDSVLLRIAGLLVSTVGSMGVGTNTHTSSHYATSDHRWVNEAAMGDLTMTYDHVIESTSTGCRLTESVVVTGPQADDVAVMLREPLAALFVQTTARVAWLAEVTTS